MPLAKPATFSASWNTQPFGSTVIMRCSASVTGLRIGSLCARTVSATSILARRLSRSHSKVIGANSGSLMVSMITEKIWNMVPTG